MWKKKQLSWLKLLIFTSHKENHSGLTSEWISTLIQDLGEFWTSFIVEILFVLKISSAQYNDWNHYHNHVRWCCLTELTFVSTWSSGFVQILNCTKHVFLYVFFCFVFCFLLLLLVFFIGWKKNVSFVSTLFSEFYLDPWSIQLGKNISLFFFFFFS